MTHMIRMSRILKPNRLSAIDYLRQSTLEESIVDLQLMNRPTTQRSQREDYPNYCWFNNGTKCFGKVDTGTLCESVKNPTSLISLERAISPKFVLEHPFSCHHIGMGWARMKVPSVVGK
jgi:hypothetical protein